MSKSGNHAQGITDMLLPYLPDGGVLLDVGGNVGKVTACVKRARPDVTVHLFEPVPLFFAKAHERLFGIDGIKMCNIGLSDVPGKATIWTVDPRNIGWSTLDKSYATDEMVKHEVTLMRLDDYPVERIDAIKLDVEYWEGKVLKGGRRTIDKHRPVILTELSRGSEDLWWERVGEMERLFEIGYQRIDYLVSKKERKDVLLVPGEKAI